MHALVTATAPHPWHVPPSAVVLEAGATARTKRLLVSGVTAATVAACWPGIALDPQRRQHGV